MKALGLIEVDGYLTAIIASDAALKSANVKLIGIEAVKSGISCVKLEGEVDAVKAAVDAGEKVAKDNGLLRSAHVIPRLHEDTAKLLTNEAFVNEETEVVVKDIEDIEDTEDIEDIKNIKSIEEIEDIEDIKDIVQQENNSISFIEDTQTVEKSDKKLNYNNMKVDQLRNYVKKLKINNLTNKQIKLLKKVQLISILDDYFKEKEEGE